MISDEHRDLVNRIMASESQAEAELIRQFRSRILIIIQRDIGYHNQACLDLLHEVLIAIIQAIRAGNFDQSKGTPLESYIYGVAKNKIRDHLRSEKKETMLRDSLEIEWSADFQDMEIEMDEVRRILKHEIRQLHLKYQEVIYLRYFDELSIPEISDRIGLPRRRVSERLNYAVKLLKKRLDGADFSQ